MANLTSTSQIDPAVNLYYDRLLCARARPDQIHSMFAQKRNVPSKSTDTIKFRRYIALSTATTPLTEGVTPAGSQLSKTDLTVKLEQYGKAA